MRLAHIVPAMICSASHGAATYANTGRLRAMSHLRLKTIQKWLVQPGPDPVGLIAPAVVHIAPVLVPIAAAVRVGHHDGATGRA